MDVAFSVGVTSTVDVTGGSVSVTFSVDDGLLNNFGDNWSFVGFLDNGLVEYFMDDYFLSFFVGCVHVLLVYDGYVLLFNEGGVLFVDNWLMVFMYMLLNYDWLMMLMDDFLMMFMKNILFVLNNHILVVLVDDVLMDFFHNRGSNVGSYVSGKLVSFNGLSFV